MVAKARRNKCESLLRGKVKQAADLEVSGLQLESDGSAFECGSLGPVNLDAFLPS